ncbi:MAG: MFS transporter [Clostridiales Family XIII bacterium]|jgi:DHA2 family lincomycin resistance protein-like MFS transporter|nr:MFS transporter [Clostridiales Family XIII bacterium]
MPNTIKNPKLIVAVAAFAAFLATFNETFMNVAFAPIMTDFHVEAATVQWLATGYMLAAAVMVPVSAFAYRSIPTKPLFLLTTGLLLIGSVIGALSPTFLMLLIGRIVQGLGTGMLIPVGMNITLEAAPREKLGTYMGIMGSMTTLGPSSSVIIAGFLLTFWDWPVLQWVFAGLSLLCFLVGLVFLPNVAKLTHPRLDAASVALVGLALIGILYGVSTVFAGSIPLAVVAVIVGILFMILFVKRQSKLEQPLIDLTPLKVKPFKIGVIINMISLVTMFAMNIIIPIFMQSVLGVSSFSASFILFPAIALCCILSPIAGRVYDKHGARILLPLGFAFICVFSVALSLFIGGGSVWLLAILYIPVIGGSALIIGPVQSLALSHLAPEQNPHGVTIMSTGFQIAGCIGASLFTGVYALVTATKAAAGASVNVSGSTGFLAAGIMTAAFAFVGILLAVKIGRYPKAVHEHHQATAGLSHIMKTDVFSLSSESNVSDALRLFAEKHISGAPIVDEQGAVTGFISDGDIMRYFADQHTSFTSPWSIIVEQGNEDFDAMLQSVMQLPVTKIATRHVISVNHDASIGAACKILLDHKLRKAPVTKDGRIVGVINLSNISHYSINAYLKFS